MYAKVADAVGAACGCQHQLLDLVRVVIERFPRARFVRVLTFILIPSVRILGDLGGVPDLNSKMLRASRILVIVFSRRVLALGKQM